MSIKMQSTASSSKDSSLRLLKQKVKKNYVTSLEITNLDRKENEDFGNERYELLSPQPPSYPRGEEYRLSVRHHEHNVANSPQGVASTGKPSLPDVGSSNSVRKQAMQGDNTGNNQNNSIRSHRSADPSEGSEIDFGHYQDQIVTIESIPAFDISSAEVGLDNLGNTCFMNSVLQCLLHVEPLVSYFIHFNIDRQLNLASPKKGNLALSFRQLVMDFYKRKSMSSISPTNLHRAVAKHAPYLMDFQQQDSQEFLRFLLDGMSEDLCRKHSELEARPEHSNRRISGNVAEKAGDTSKQQGFILPALPSSTALSGNLSPDMVRKSVSGHTELISTSNELIGSNKFSTPTVQSSSVSHAQKLRNETQLLRSVEELNSPANVNPGPESSGSPSNRSSGVVPLALDSLNLSSKLRIKAEIHSARNREVESHTADLGHVKSINGGGSGEYERAKMVVQAADEVVEFGNDADSVSNDAVSAMTSRSESGIISPTQEPNGVSNNITDAEDNSYQGRFKRAFGRGRKKSPRVNDSAEPGKEVGPANNNTIKTSENEQPTNQRIEAAAKDAEAAWGKYLKLNDSIITDIFAGQLQSTIECLGCGHRSSTYDPFLDLSVPIYREGESSSHGKGLLGTLRSTVSSAVSDASNKSTLEKCLQKFTGEETLEGENMVTCEKCKVKSKCVKRMSIYRYPRVLVVHIKRFKYSSTRREKLSTDVLFPLSGLDLTPFLSPDVVLKDDKGVVAERIAPVVEGTPHSLAGIRHNFPPVYDLIGVSNHHGSMNSGHYIAHVDMSGGRQERPKKWMCFNDSRVSVANAANIAGPTAYVLFYKLQQY